MQVYQKQTLFSSVNAGVNQGPHRKCNLTLDEQKAQVVDDYFKFKCSAPFCIVMNFDTDGTLVNG